MPARERLQLCLRELRRRATLSQKEIADALGVTQTAVSYWETGKREPNIRDILGLSEVLRCSTDQLLGAGICLDCSGTGSVRPDWGGCPNCHGTGEEPEVALTTANQQIKELRRERNRLEILVATLRGGRPTEQDIQRADEVASSLLATSPEACRRCGSENPAWSASSPLWNAVMRGGSINGESIWNDLVCATCFMVLAQERGVASCFRVTAENVNVELETVTPSGRVWDAERFLWIEPAQESSE